MTEVEQALTGPLTCLRSAGYADLVRMLLGGPDARAHGGRASAPLSIGCALGDAGGFADRAMRALVLGAMRRG